jgi:transposase
MQKKPSIASQMVPLLAQQVIGHQSLRVQTIPLAHRVLTEIGFASAVDCLCQDDGDVAANKILQALIHSRLQSQKPVPLSHVQEWVGQSILPQVLDFPSNKLNDSRLGRVLELVADAAPTLWIDLIKRAHRAYPFDLDLVIYDTSSWYFEGEYEKSDIVKFGYSRDGKSECKQVNIGLNVAGDYGIPILYQVHPGNKEDTTTVAENLAELQKLFKQIGDANTRLQVLGDRAMLNVAKLRMYHQAKTDVIGSMIDCNFNQAVLLSVTEEELLANPLSYVAERYQHLPKKRQEAERYYAVRTLAVVPAGDQPGEAETFKVPALVVLRSGKKRLDMQHREALLDKAEKRLQDIQDFLSTGQRKYANEQYADTQIKAALSKYAAIKGMLTYKLLRNDANKLNLTWSRVNERIQQAAKEDGRCVVYFTRDTLTTDEVFAYFKSRDLVEKRVDQVKGPGPVVVRPIYFHKDSRIRGIIFVCMVAALVTGLIERQVHTKEGYKATGEGIQQLFADFGAGLQTFSDFSQIITMPRTSKWQDIILNSVDAQLPPVTPVSVTEWRFAEPSSAPRPSWMTDDPPDPAARGT